jgi:hypothetical protein
LAGATTAPAITVTCITATRTKRRKSTDSGLPRIRVLPRNALGWRYCHRLPPQVPKESMLTTVAATMTAFVSADQPTEPPTL